MVMEVAQASGIDDKFVSLYSDFIIQLLMRFKVLNYGPRLLWKEHKLWTEENSLKCQNNFIKEIIVMMELTITCLKKGTYLLFMK